MYLSPWCILCKETGEYIITSFYTVDLYLLCGIGFWAAGPFPAGCADFC